MAVFSTVIFILELVALAALIICVALMTLNAGNRVKRLEDKSERPEQWPKSPEHVYCRCRIYSLDKKRKCKRRPKGQTGRKHPKGKREA